MAKFYVGQRVKFVRRDGEPGHKSLPIGAEGTILQHDGLPAIDGRMYEYDISFANDQHYRYRGLDGWQIEPLYDGHTKVSWDECAWKPEGVSA